MSKQKNTPYQLVTNDRLFRNDTIVDKDGKIILSIENLSTDRSQSELIVKACNNHDRLVEALEESKIVFQEYGMIGRVNKIEQLLTEIKQ